MSEVPVQPQLAQHRDECGEQRHQQTRIQEVYGCDDLRRGTIPRWGSGGVFVRDNGPVEAEEDCSEVGFRSFAGIGLEPRLDGDDKGGADCGEQTGLRTWSTLYSDEENAETHENQDGVEIFIVPLHVLVIVRRGLSFVSVVEIELGVIAFDGLEVHP